MSEWLFGEWIYMNVYVTFVFKLRMMYSWSTICGRDNLAYRRSMGSLNVWRSKSICLSVSVCMLGATQPLSQSRCLQFIQWDSLNVTVFFSFDIIDLFKYMVG